MKFLVAIFFILAASTIGAQTANVIELEPADAAKVQQAWDTLQKAQADWEAAQKLISEHYALVKRGDPDAGSTATTINWDSERPEDYMVCRNISSDPECFKAAQKSDKKRREWDDIHARYYRKGFENGFEFSKDFKYIVPKQMTYNLPDTSVVTPSNAPAIWHYPNTGSPLIGLPENCHLDKIQNIVCP